MLLTSACTNGLHLTILFLQFWYSKQAAEGNAPGHQLGFNSNRQFGPIKVVRAGGGDDHLPNIDMIVAGDGNVEDLDLVSRFSG